MKFRQERWIWSLYLDISIDLLVIGRVDAHLLRLLKGFNGKSDGAGSRFVLLSCYWSKMRITHSDAIYSMRYRSCLVQFFPQDSLAGPRGEQRADLLKQHHTPN